MSEKQLEKLLDGFVKSSQSLSSLQEGILSLHGVMEEFHKTAENFALKNEIETLLPKVNQQFTQANDVYSTISDNLKKIQLHTEEMQARGEMYSENVEQSWKQLNHIQEYLQKYLDEIIPFYGTLGTELEIVGDAQQSTELTMKNMHTDMNKILNMHSELTRKLEQHKELLSHTGAQQQDVVSTFKMIGELGSQCAVQSAETFAELKEISTYLKQYTQEMVPAYQSLQAEVEQLKGMQNGMVEVAHEISSSVRDMNVMQQELQLQMIEYRRMMSETKEMQGELLSIAQKNLAMNAFVEKMKATDQVANEYFTNICEKWQQEHLNAAVEKWAEENLDEVILKKIKGALGLRWK
ncbi:hypothetical protein [Pelosinus sp. sgz500959]|uniref:hypothetical protein n=1 Tax=Pelosinus sp. sgz500959 TaxID=3242472 RepID=UPI00366C148E